MRDRQLFRQPELKVDQLAEAVKMASHYLSYVVNTHSGRNFQSWLNSMRVAYAADALARAPERSIVEIGFEAGFNSKASFNRVFKAETGLSPSEFRRLKSQSEATNNSKDGHIS